MAIDKKTKEHDELFHGSYFMTLAYPLVLIITHAQVHQLPLFFFSAPLNYLASNPYKGKKKKKNTFES